VRRELPIAAVNFTFPAPLYAEDLRKLFPGPVNFDCDRGELVFASTLLDLKARRTIQDLRRCLDRYPRDWLSLRFVQQPLAGRVREFLAQAEPRAFSVDETALHLCISSRSLSRHLKEEGTSFQQIKDELRFDLAIIRLTQSEIPLCAIAEELGFSDLSSFHRAFRSWSGVSPGSYRRRVRKHRRALPAGFAPSEPSSRFAAVDGND
jgi:AraC-like DNA-binding protein